MKREIKTTLALDGEKKFKQGLADAARQMRVLDSEIKASTATFKGNEKSLDALTSRGKIFERQVAQQKEVVRALSQAVQESAQKYGEADKRTDGYRIKLNNATAALTKMERELEQNSKAISEFGQDADKAASKMDKLKAKAQQMADGLKNAGDKLSGMGQKMSMYVTAPVVAAGAMSFKAAADVEDAMGAADQVFKGSADNMKAWADSLESYYGIAKGEALEYGNMMGSMLQNIGGLTEDEAAKQAQTLIKLAGDLTAMYGGTTQDAVRALTGSLKGNNTMLDNYGMAANDALVKAKALEMGLIREGESMDLATKQAATLALIMEQSSAAQGQAARERTGASGAMREFTTELKNLSTAFGEHLLPAITPLISSLKDLIKAFAELSPATQKTIIAFAGIAAALGPVMTVVGNLMKVAGGVIGFFVPAADGVSKFTKVLRFLAPVARVAISAVRLLAGAFSWPVVIISAVVAAGVALYKNWDTVSAKAVELWQKIGVAWENIKSAVTGALQKIIGDIGAYSPVGLVVSQWDEIKAYIGAAWENIKTAVGNALQTVIGLFRQYTPVGIVISQWDEIKNAISSKINAAKDAVRNALDAIYSFFANLRLPEIKIPHIKLPHFSIQGEFDLRNFRVPSLGVEWYAKGGIFNSPSIIGVGEAGTEAVIPLDRLERMLARYMQPAGREINIEVNNYSTKPESAEKATTRELQKLQYLGVFA